MNVPAEALELTRQAMEIVQALGTLEEGDAWVRIIHAEALEANGNRAGAHAALRDAFDRLQARAKTIRKPAWREAFLARSESTRIAEHMDAWMNDQ
jgi:hypothetical protein